MNRIYQGRVTRIEAKKEDGTFEQVAFGQDQSTCPLWQHHTIFQDAVNYYLLAMASLAKEQIKGADKLMSDLPKRMVEAWETFPRTDAARAGARSLRDSVAPWIGLDGSSTIDQAYDSILNGNKVDKKALSYALALVLEECSGDSGIQQGGREYLPKLCVSDFDGTFDYSVSALASDNGKHRLGKVLHGNPSEGDLRKIASEMDLSWMVKISPEKFYEGEEAIKRLNQAIDHLELMIVSPSERLRAYLVAVPDAVERINSMRDAVKTMPEGFRVVRNKKPPSLDVLFSAIAFMAFPSFLTAACLKLGISETPASAESTKSKEGIEFASLGDDPVKLARGARGYVFPAFTALPRWKPANPGKPAWKEFDIAAFKEALKALNQFRLKTEEREEKKANLEGLIAHLIGSPIKGWKPSREDGEEGEIPDPIDPILLKLGWALEEEMTRGLSESVVGEKRNLSFGAGCIPHRDGGWTVTRASLRGLRDIVQEWRKKTAKNGPEVSTETLAKVVKNYQGREEKAASIGSVGLFLTLCEPRFRPLWMTVDEDEGDEAEENRFLRSLADLHDSVEEYERCKEAINLTPAEPRHSSRHYPFDDLAYANRKKGPTKKELQQNKQFLDEGCFDLEMIREERNGHLGKQSIRIHYSAPRFRRDGLSGSDREGWLQPMMKALDLKKIKTIERFDPSFTLMPEFGELCSLRFLLNFVAVIDPEPMQVALGKALLWNKQFHGFKEKKKTKHIYLHWPGTADPSKMKVTPWWENPSVVEQGFTVLATDLGQRTAGAWALLRVTASKNDSPRPIRSIGHDGKREWFAEILKTGMHRLPGEDAYMRNKGGLMEQEKSGKTGRIASEAEWRESLELAKALLADCPENWVGERPDEKSYSEQNDSLIVLANRRLSRLGTFHRWSCFDPEKESDPARRKSLVWKLVAELEQWEDEEVRGWASALASGDVAAFKESAGRAFAAYRYSLLPLLVRLAERVAPLREDRWEWIAREDGTPYGNLIRKPRDPGAVKPLVRGQRGLSLARIEQMENLRRLFLRYNRSLDREAGQPAAFGRADAGRSSGEPCRDLLEKIDRIKEQRVDQTAHLILAQALGVKLAPHSLDGKARLAGDHHGEYEKISGREPVDLVVIEDLSRYLSSQGRAPSENSRLMKWAHRAIRDKVKMLVEEPFGIPVLEVPAAYSSRFSAVTGEPGSRCEERASLDDYLQELYGRRANTPPTAGHSDMRPWNRNLLGQFERLAGINATRLAAGKSPKTLLIPKTGGPLFLGAKESSVVQSDMNAAINLGFRAVAAPGALDLIHRIRSEKSSEQITTVAKSKREIAAYGGKGVPITIKGTSSTKLSKSANFFHDAKGIARFDNGEITLGGKTITVASGIGLWHAVNEAFLPRIVALNEERLMRILPVFDEKDEIPM